MPIDFPSNPTNGQVYGNWIYDSSITAWRNVNTDTGIGTLNAMGLKNVVPTSIQVGSGSATVNANGTVTFNGVTSISLNGVFTSAYENYKVVISGGLFNTSANAELWLRLRSSGTDRSASYYTNGLIQIGASAPSASYTNNYDRYSFMNLSTNNYASATMEVHSPAVSTYETIIDSHGRGFSGSTYYFATTCLYDANQANDGFTLGAGTGTMTGTVQIFGYTN